ncbi:unnamed protein product [Didymodactylos carnosus]|uniref:Uncharacterized protein n=1 Tax=Didymodactylos carnosus TaxID=1234261 RepID=A0A815GHN7_9BILA|nr:unnamed protein product [Didymodactylos carnosus]CAF4199827.1 unnamed protein product [Didymodactylos carnosus]
MNDSDTPQDDLDTTDIIEIFLQSDDFTLHNVAYVKNVRYCTLLFSYRKQYSDACIRFQFLQLEERFGFIRCIVQHDNNSYILIEELLLLGNIKIKLNKINFCVPFILKCKPLQQFHLKKFDDIISKLSYQILPGNQVQVFEFPNILDSS